MFIWLNNGVFIYEFQKQVSVFWFYFLIFLNLSIVCAGSNDNLTVVEPSFDEFNDVDVIYAGDLVEINRYFRESIFFHGEVGDSLFIAKIKDKSGMLWVLVKM